MQDFEDDYKETDRLKRINLLAKKSKEVGLTPEEIAERDILRKEYLKAFRANFVHEVEKICFVEKDGSHTPVRRKIQA
ncbi:MAG: DUF896 domain-containing protein [Anaerotignaceae bacterium]